MKIKALLFLILSACIVAFWVNGRGYWHPIYTKTMGSRTVADVIDLYGDSSRASMKPYFESVEITYPPKKLAFLALKDQDKLELWASDNSAWKKVKEYDIAAASGGPGPKLQEGDRQVPEGIYSVIGLNPNSSYHLSMKLNYPNSFDLKWAQKEGRTQPGSNIFIHGKSVSIGCLAMGDPAIEQLFVLAHDTGIANIKVIIAPTDPRLSKLVPPGDAPTWVTGLYQTITSEFEPFRGSGIQTPE